MVERSATPTTPMADEYRITTQRFVEEETLSLSAVEAWGDKLVVVEFNQDRLIVFNQQGQPYPCTPELGQYEGVMEGAQTPVVEGERLWVNFGLSGRLIHLDLAELDLEDPECDMSLSCTSLPQASPQ